MSFTLNYVICLNEKNSIEVLLQEVNLDTMTWIFCCVLPPKNNHSSKRKIHPPICAYLINNGDDTRCWPKDKEKPGSEETVCCVVFEVFLTSDNQRVSLIVPSFFQRDYLILCLSLHLGIIGSKTQRD